MAGGLVTGVIEDFVMLSTASVFAAVLLLTSFQPKSVAELLSCDISRERASSIDMAGFAANGRQTVTGRIWSDRASQISYSEAWQVDSTRIQRDGSVWFDPNGLPTRYESRRMRGVQRDTARVELSTRGGLLVPNVFDAATLMLVAQCAWHQPDRRVITVMGDTITVREAFSLQLTRPDTTPKQVTLYEVSIKGVNSYYSKVWLDEGGEMFATRFLNAADIYLPTAWRASATRLLLATAEAAEPRMRETARLLGRTPASGVVFVNVRVLDVERARILEGMSVLVQGSTIRSIQPSATMVAPPGAELVDGTMATLIPGLFDLGRGTFPDPEFDASGRRQLASGVTSLQMVFADTVFTPRNIRRIESGIMLAPRVFPACTLDGWYPDSVNGAVPPRRTRRGQVRNVGDVRQLISACARLGMRWTMLHENLPADLTGPAIRESRRLGMRVTGNRLRGRTTLELIEAGFDQFQHSLQVIASFVEHDSSAFAWWFHRSGGINPFWSSSLPALNLASDEVQTLIQTMARRSIGTLSTLCVYPPANRGLTRDTTLDRASFVQLQKLMVALRDAGAPVFAATDGACSIVDELELLRDGGFTTRELLRMATIDAAEMVGRRNELGSISVGKSADLVLVAGNPLEDLSSLRNVKAVMKGGVLITDIPALQAALPFLRGR